LCAPCFLQPSQSYTTTWSFCSLSGFNDNVRTIAYTCVPTSSSGDNVPTGITVGVIVAVVVLSFLWWYHKNCRKNTADSNTTAPAVSSVPLGYPGPKSGAGFSEVPVEFQQSQQQQPYIISNAYGQGNPYPAQQMMPMVHMQPQPGAFSPCVRCHTAVPLGATFCSSCGTPVPVASGHQSVHPYPQHVAVAPIPIASVYAGNPAGMQPFVAAAPHIAHPVPPTVVHPVPPTVASAQSLPSTIGTPAYDAPPAYEAPPSYDPIRILPARTFMVMLSLPSSLPPSLPPPSILFLYCQPLPATNDRCPLLPLCMLTGVLQRHSRARSCRYEAATTTTNSSSYL
jgi:hypothetical protein